MPWLENRRYEALSVKKLPSILTPHKGPQKRVKFRVLKSLLERSDFCILECESEQGETFHLKIKGEYEFWINTSGEFWLGSDWSCGKWVHSLWMMPDLQDVNIPPCSHQVGFEAMLPLLTIFLRSCSDSEAFLKSDDFLVSTALFVHMAWGLICGFSWSDLIHVFGFEGLQGSPFAASKPSVESRSLARPQQRTAHQHGALALLSCERRHLADVPQSTPFMRCLRVCRPNDLHLRETWHFCGDPKGLHPIAVGAAPSWSSVRSTLLRPYATVGERLDFATQTDGWLSTDEWAHAATKIRRPASACHLMPLCQYVPTNDDFVFDIEDCHVPNTGVSLLPILLGSHWIGAEIDRVHDMPEVTLLMVPIPLRNRVERFVCQMLHIPPHRVRISFGLDSSPPLMCGWVLLQRWIGLLHAQDAFFNVLHEYHALSEDRKRIIHRVLQSSVLSWERTGASDTLQQIAYTIRQSFLTNMFHFSPTVHTRLDSLSVVAAGQPLHVFPNHNMPQNVQQTTSVVEVQTQTMSLNDGLVETHTQTEALNISSERNLVVHARMLPAHIRRRLQEFAIQPDKAASDEIDFVLRCFRDSVQGVCILPCCLWDRGIQTVRVISGQELQGWSTWDTRVLILAADHWFLAQVYLDGNIFVIHVHGFRLPWPADFNDFICAFANFLGIGLPHVQAFRFECPAPWRMCGFSMLLALFRSCHVSIWPTVDDAIQYLQQHREQELLTYIGQHALQAWNMVTTDPELLHFAFTVRAAFLEELLRTEESVTHASGGAIGSESSLPVLTDKTRNILMQHVRSHMPVDGICACMTKGFTAQATLKQYIQDWAGVSMVSCRIVQPTSPLGDRIGNLQCAWPQCTHTKARFAHVLLPREMWEAIGPDQMVFLIEAKILWQDGTPLVDLRSPQSGLIRVDLNRKPDDCMIRVGELFAGGFSGWSFGIKSLQAAHLPIQHVFSVENDAVMAKLHACNHSPHQVLSSPAQAAASGIDGKTPVPGRVVQTHICVRW